VRFSIVLYGGIRWFLDDTLSFKKAFYRNLESVSDRHDVADSDIMFCAFQRTDVGTVQSTEFGENVLLPAAFLPYLANPFAQ